MWNLIAIIQAQTALRLIPEKNAAGVLLNKERFSF